jgi:hypothetical protein
MSMPPPRSGERNLRPIRRHAGSVSTNSSSVRREGGSRR